MLSVGVNKILSGYFAARCGRIDNMMKNPIDCQHFVLKKLLSSAQQTRYGHQYDFASIANYGQFAQRVPVNDYQSLYPYIEQMIKGEKNVLWSGKVNWFAKSSGTSGSKSKFIPLSQESLWYNNYQSGRDTLSLYISHRPDSKLFMGKTFSLTGSLQSFDINSKARCGDISAFLLKGLPFWANLLKTPPYKIALMSDWNEKLECFAQHMRKQDVRAMAGVPSWILMIVKRVLELEQKDNLCDVWPNLELFMHGGVNFAPYKKQYQHITNENLCFWQVYNASEGYFATQDRLVADDMLLLVDNGVFFEFIPLQDFVSKDYAKAVPLEQVKLDRNYVIVISTNAGLWRYVIGDVVRFTSLNPYRIIITGRTTNFVNAFGEELIVDNAEKAIAFACQKTNAIVNEYTMAPVYPSSTQQAAHQWLIEFEQAPQSLSQFVQLLDEELKNQNSDYEAKRTADILLQNPIVQQIPYGTFLKWLASKNKLGGQFKVPRLSNDRHVIEEILSMVNK